MCGVVLCRSSIRLYIVICPFTIIFRIVKWHFLSVISLHSCIFTVDWRYILPFIFHFSFNPLLPKRCLAGNIKFVKVIIKGGISCTLRLRFPLVPSMFDIFFDVEFVQIAILLTDLGESLIVFLILHPWLK